ncbi:hypothetical protein BDZ88DRAFT_404552 [Geranomyces variabilis]|nr:hypothetical protein BDZ88DRAFT_404552 [Geranomyces variabilis]KAJ3143472.1 hypothetical protein HDU90_000233 [Geranomyces variabilis]
MADTNGTDGGGFAHNATHVPDFDPVAFYNDVLAFFPTLLQDPAKALDELPHVAASLAALLILPSLLWLLLRNTSSGKTVVNALDQWSPATSAEASEELEQAAFTAPVTETPWEVGVSATAVAVSEDGTLRGFEIFPAGGISAEQILSVVIRAISEPLEKQKVQRPKLMSILQSRQCSDAVLAEVCESVGKFGIKAGATEALGPQLAEYVARRKAEMERALQNPTPVVPVAAAGAPQNGPKPEFIPTPNRGCFVCKQDIEAKPSQCSACKAMIYCSTVCSKKDWPTHKLLCPSFKLKMQRIETEHIHDLPFDYYNEKKQLHSYNQVTFLVQKDVHNIGVFRRLCACYAQVGYGELAGQHIAQLQQQNIQDPLERFKLFGLSQALYPLSAAYPEGFDVRSIDSWKTYYEVRGIPFDDPAALVLEVPMTVWHLINKYVLDDIKPGPDGRRSMTIHLAGVEKEADLSALFEVLLSLLPKTDIVVHMVSPAVSPRLPPQHGTLGIRNEAMDSTIIVTLRNGLYSPQHLSGEAYKAEGLPFGIGKPDAVIIMNSALLSMQSWLPTIKMLIDNKQKTLFTEQMEHTVDLIANQLATIGCPLTVPATVNPFRQPVLAWKKDTNLVGWSNGFIFGIY